MHKKTSYFIQQMISYNFTLISFIQLPWSRSLTFGSVIKISSLVSIDVDIILRTINNLTSVKCLEWQKTNQLAFPGFQHFFHSWSSMQKFDSIVLVLTLHVLVEPVEHVCSGLLDTGFVSGVDVFSLAVDKPMSLTRKDLHLIVYFAFLLQFFFQNTHLNRKKKDFFFFFLWISAKCFCIHVVFPARTMFTHLVQRDDLIFLPKNEQCRALQLIPVLPLTDDPCIK